MGVGAPTPRSRTGVLALHASARPLGGKNRRRPEVRLVPDLRSENFLIDRLQQPLERQRFGFRNGRNVACSGHPGEHHGVSEFPHNLVSLEIAGLKLQLFQRQGYERSREPLIGSGAPLGDLERNSSSISIGQLSSSQQCATQSALRRVACLHVRQCCRFFCWRSATKSSSRYRSSSFHSTVRSSAR